MNLTFMEGKVLLALARSKREFVEAFCKLEQAARRYGLKVNETKVKYITKKKGGTPQRNYATFTSKTKEYLFEEVDHFEYLGTTVTADRKENAKL